MLYFTQAKDGVLKLSPEPFHLDEVFKKIQTRYFHKGEHTGINIEFNQKGIPGMLKGDSERLIEISNHLVENAVKFNSSEASAKISVRIVENYTESALLEFKITDNGIGISKEYHESIFEPFFQVDTSSSRQYDGVGIGLSL